MPTVTTPGPERTPSRNFYAIHAGIPLLAVLGLLLLEMTSADRTVSGWFYDAAAARFPLHYNATFEIIAHQWAKYLVVLVGCAVVVGYLMSFIIPALRTRRRLLLFLSLALTLAPATVSLLKATSL